MSSASKRKVSHLTKYTNIVRGIKRSISNWIKKEPFYFFLVFFIIILSFFFHTHNYTDRVFLQADNSRDVQIARYAADNLKIPQIGQFSSAGPFFYGPWYYWLLEIFSFIPLGFLTHWYMMTTLYMVFILLTFWLGKEVGGKWLGALAALFAAISPTQISFSFSVWNPAIVPLLALITLIFLIRLLKYKQYLDIFLLGFFVGLAINIHFQNLLLIPTLLVVLVIVFTFHLSFIKFLKYLIILAVGFIIPFFPLIWWDIHHHWHNSISLFIYLTIDQYKIWVPNRWLTYIGNYWPETYAAIIGGNQQLGALIIMFVSVFTLWNLKNFTRYKYYYVIAISFVSEVILYRYYRGERYWYYSLFSHPSVFIITAWMSVQFFKIQKVAGIFLILMIIYFTLNSAVKDLKPRGVTLEEIISLKQEFYQNFTNEKFNIYGCASNPASIGHPIGLMTYYDGRSSLNGIKIGVCESAASLSWVRLEEKDVQTEKVLWVNESTPVVYKSTVEWWKEKPSNNGNFWEFIKKNFNPKCYPNCG